MLMALTGPVVPERCLRAEMVVKESIQGNRNVPNEKLLIFTDRMIYAVGENILFRIFNISPHDMKVQGWSTVAYLELIDVDHVSLARGKYVFGKNGAEGTLEIPVSVPTGNYYLRAYTKWMRNFSPSAYAWRVITVVNPFKDEIRGSAATVDFGAMPKKDTGRIDHAIQCSATKKHYGKREKVTLEVTVPHNMPESPDGYCLSVARTPAVDSDLIRMNGKEHENTEDTAAIRFIPELKGMSVSGRIVTKEGNLPSPDAHVHLSVMGEHPDYLGVATDAYGRFILPLPERSGQLELFLGVETSGDEPVDILIDNDFSPEHFIPSLKVPLTFWEENKQIAREIMVNMQIGKVFGETKVPPVTMSEEPGQYPCFYGKPPIIIHIDDYVQLPTLEEFIIELIPQINIVRRKGETSLTLIGTHSDLAFYKPLVLMDMVPVFDLDALLHASYEDIARIEVVNATYVRGDFYFGGIISIFSRKGNLAGLDFKKNAYFIDMMSYKDPLNNKFPDYSGESIHNLPDFRNTLFWKANIQIPPGKRVYLDFFTSDNTGEYTFIFKGVAPDGTILTGEGNFTVQ